MNGTNENLIPNPKGEGGFLAVRIYVRVPRYLTRSSIVHRREREHAVSSQVLLTAGGVALNPWVSVGGGTDKTPPPSRVGSP